MGTKVSWKNVLGNSKKIGKERGNSYWKNEEISGQKAYINTQKLN